MFKYHSILAEMARSFCLGVLFGVGHLASSNRIGIYG